MKNLSGYQLTDDEQRGGWVEHEPPQYLYLPRRLVTFETFDQSDDLTQLTQLTEMCKIIKMTFLDAKYFWFLYGTPVAFYG